MHADPSARPRRILNGGWEFAPAPPEPPANLPPHLNWGEPGGCLMRTRLELSRQPGRREWLIFERIAGRAVFYLNGLRAYASRENCLPVEFDLSDKIASREVELAIWCGPHAFTDTPLGPAYRAPGGGLPPGLVGPVWLEEAPAVSIPDSAARLRPQPPRLELDISLENRTLETVQAELHAALWENGAPVLELPAQPVSLAAGVLTTLRLAHPWPGRPGQVYTLVARLERSGQLLDERRQRFGPPPAAHLDFSAAPLRTYASLAEAEADFRRHGRVRLAEPPRPEILDAASAAGVLLEVASPVYGGGALLDVAHPEFLEACAETLRAWVRRDRSHPAIAAWRLDRAMPSQPGYAAYRRARPALRDQILRLDPTRPVQFDEEG